MREPQHELPFQTARAPRPSPAEIGGRIVYWMPVLIALGVLAQFALLGLRPALAESRRLARAEEELDARLERELALNLELDRTLRAQSDPIYIERERRLLGTRAGPPSER